MNVHPEFVDEAMELALSDKQPYSWRAAWLLWSYLDENDNRIKKHFGKIVSSLKGKKDGHQRELLKMLLLVELEKKYEGELFNICTDIWEQINKDPSVRLTALKFLFKIIERHPELSREITFITQEHYLESSSPAVKKSISKMIKKFNSTQSKKQIGT